MLLTKDIVRQDMCCLNMSYRMEKKVIEWKKTAKKLNWKLKRKVSVL